jgi:hypothetical protein
MAALVRARNPHIFRTSRFLFGVERDSMTLAAQSRRRPDHRIPDSDDARVRLRLPLPLGFELRSTCTGA